MAIPKEYKEFVLRQYVVDQPFLREFPFIWGGERDHFTSAKNLRFLAKNAT